MFLNNFKSVSVDSYYSTINDAGALTDSRFAVINGLMFELSTVDSVDDSFSVMIGAFDAEGVYNPSHGEDVTKAYGNIIACFELRVSAELCEDNANTIIAEQKGDAAFMQLIHSALVDFQSLKQDLTRGSV